MKRTNSKQKEKRRPRGQANVAAPRRADDETESKDQPNQFLTAGAEDGVIIIQVHTICSSCGHEAYGTFACWKSIDGWFLLEDPKRCKGKNCRFKFNTLIALTPKTAGETVFSRVWKRARHVRSKIRRAGEEGKLESRIDLSEFEQDDAPENPDTIIDIGDGMVIEVVDQVAAERRAVEVRRRITGSEPPKVEEEAVDD